MGILEIGDYLMNIKAIFSLLLLCFAINCNATNLSPVSGKDLGEAIKIYEEIKETKRPMSVDEALFVGSLFGFIGGMNYDSMIGVQTFCIAKKNVSLEDEITVISKFYKATPEKFNQLNAGFLVNHALTKSYPCPKSTR